MKKLLFIVLIAVLGMTACGPTPEELVEQGKKHIENENYTEAMACFQKAAEKGNAEAEYNIADLYWGGLGVEEDYETAAEWLKKAAENDYPEAQNALAALYYNGMGVPQDFEKAAKWAKKAADYDMAEAQFVLANLYADGKGVPQDYNKAAELFLKVEKKGGDVAKEAQTVLFVMYLEGWGVPQSDDKAVEMLRKASGLSLAEAQFRLGELYDRGNKELGIASDTEKATKWYRKSAENGNATAQYYVGNAYQRGLGVAKSLTDAKYWWQKAADQGHEKAKEALKELAKAENAKRTGVFSVGSNKKVVFSKGNLQYQASTRTWRFAEHQWDIIGSENSKISEHYSGWIDLFGWGTSGYNGKNPWMTSETEADYGNGERDIAGTYYDWGLYITISNGGGKRWRTLTGDEWEYVFDKRSTNSGIRYAKATVNGVNGVILLPDNWNSNTYRLNKTNKFNASYSSNRISQSDWISKFECNGSVFLPAAGFRVGTSVYSVCSTGGYWSASCKWTSQARRVSLFDSTLIIDDRSPRRNGFSVRLVCPVEN